MSTDRATTTNTNTGSAANVPCADALLVDTVDAMLRDHCTPERTSAAEHAGGFDDALWKLVTEAGLHLVGVPESAGGSGGTLHDAVAVVRACGYHAAAVPLAETLHAALVLADEGAAPAAGAASVAVRFGGAARAWCCGPASAVVVRTGRGLTMRTGVAADARNVAGEPHAHLPADEAATAGHSLIGALLRSSAAAGALARTAELSVQYATEREQFGKPIGKFQILQHYLAEMAGEAVTAQAAADNAVDVITALGWGPGAPLSLALDATRSDPSALASAREVIAASRVVTGRATAVVTRLAHQLHGAIGYTDEHRLQHWTRRLWAWRDEHGSDHEWAAVLGASLTASGGAALWPRLTAWPPAR